MTIGRPISFEHHIVLDQALRLFWTRGYEKVSVDDICVLTNLSKPSLYNSFGSKEDLFIQCMEKYELSVVSPLFKIMLDEQDPVAGVLKMLRAAASQFQNPDMPTGCLAITGLIESIGKSKRIDRRFKILQTKIVTEFENYFLLREGTDVGVPAKKIGQYVLGQLYALAAFSRSNRELFDFESFIELSEASIRFLYRGKI